MASNHGRDTLRREDVFSVWFTLKPSLIPAWWLPWVFAAPDLTPIVLAQSNFWALFGLPRASYLIMKQRERERGEELSMRTWLLETHILGQSSLSKPVLLVSPEIIKKKELKKNGLMNGHQKRENKSKKSLTVPLKVQKMDINCCLQNMSCFSSLPASHQSKVII